MTRLAPLLLALLFAATSLAQRELLVNGATVAGLDTRLVPGTAYAPAVDLARAFGAALAIDAPSARVTLTLGAAVVSFAIVDDPSAVADPAPAVTRDGAPRSGPAALWNAGRVYLPVKALGEALGGNVAYLAENAVVAVVLPRPTLRAALEGMGEAEALVFALSAPTRVTAFLRDGEVELRFDRTDLPEPIAASGGRFVSVAVAAVRGNVHATATFASDLTPSIVELPDGEGMRVVVAFVPPRAVDAPAAAAASGGAPVATVPGTDAVSAVVARWVLDADHGPGDDGVATRAFVDLLADALQRAGVAVERTRSGPAPVSLDDRAAAGAAGDGFLSVHEAELAPRSIRLWVLGDAEQVEALDRAIRLNAAAEIGRAETDALRRSLALALSPRLDAGAAWAAALASELRSRGFAVDPPLAAPLAVLAGAAGRGVLLELHPVDLADPEVATALADALVRAWLAVPR